MSTTLTIPGTSGIHKCLRTRISDLRRIILKTRRLSQTQLQRSISRISRHISSISKGRTVIRTSRVAQRITASPIDRYYLFPWQAETQSNSNYHNKELSFSLAILRFIHSQLILSLLILKQQITTIIMLILLRAFVKLIRRYSSNNLNSLVRCHPTATTATITTSIPIWLRVQQWMVSTTKSDDAINQLSSPSELVPWRRWSPISRILLQYRFLPSHQSSRYLRESIQLRAITMISNWIYRNNSSKEAKMHRWRRTRKWNSSSSPRLGKWMLLGYRSMKMKSNS